MKQFLAIFFFSICIAGEASGQYSRYLVWIKDKAATSFTLNNPDAYLSPRAIDRRTRYNIAIDSSDLPVPDSYINQVQSIPNVTVLNSSRWLNAIAIQTTDANAITLINALPFVSATNGIAGKAGMRNKDNSRIEITPLYSRPTKANGIDYFNYGSNSFNEIHLHNGEFLHNIGLRGQGMQITMLDGGFFNYTGLKAFDSVNANGQVLSTWDFVSRNATVTDDNSHGMMCFSTIAANIPGQFVGKAPKASFHLFRTEDAASEYPIEEFNWACGAERADSSGADVISSSLGYGYEFDSPVADYPYSDLNGDITMSARAADLAAKKGLLVFNSAGNSGNDYWRFITTPADADSIVAVGAVNILGNVGSFSSYGPAPDGRVKPDMASVGVAALVQGTGNTVGTANGTSFAGPNMAGLGTCLWQGFPEFNNMQIIQALKEAGSIYSSPDNRIGYGIPDLKAAFSSLLIQYARSSATADGCNAVITWSSKDVGAMKYEVERKGPGEQTFARIAEVNAEPGNSLANHSYEYSNSLEGLGAGQVYYRIRQIIDTSIAGYTALHIDTSVVAITSACTSSTGNQVRLAPNPATGNSNLIIETNDAIDKLTINVYDMKGSLVLQLNRAKPAGRYTTEIPSTQLPAGKYIVRVMDHQSVVGKVILLKL